MFSQFGVPPEYSFIQTVFINQLKLAWVIIIGRVKSDLSRARVARAYRSSIGRG